MSSEETILPLEKILRSPVEFEIVCFNLQLKEDALDEATRACEQLTRDYSSFARSYQMPEKVTIHIKSSMHTSATNSFLFGDDFISESEITLFYEKVEDVLPVLRHELCHLYTFSCFGITPRWLDEGVSATYENDSMKKEQCMIAQLAYLDGRAFPLQELLHRTVYPPSKRGVDKMNNPVFIYYAQSYMFVEYLHEKGFNNADILSRLQNEKIKNATIQVAQYFIEQELMSMTGQRNLAELENDFRTFIYERESGLTFASKKNPETDLLTR